MKRYVYPRLADRDFGFVRIGGPGLANCLFIAAHAAVVAREMGGDVEVLRPAWERFGIGQFLRHEKDKRFYAGLFKGKSFWGDIRKLWLRVFSKHVTEVAWDRSYFHPLWPHAEFVRQYVLSSIEPAAIAQVPEDMKASIAVHVRLGDFPQEYRTPIAWYKERIEEKLQEAKGATLDIQLFSDGTNDELKPLTDVAGVHRVFYGNAIADIIAISRCGFLIGSDSTFSTWGAFLGKVPCVFAHLTDCPPFDDAELCKIISAEVEG